VNAEKIEPFRKNAAKPRLLLQLADNESSIAGTNQRRLSPASFK
jgi:hypothetical protein